MLKPVWLALLLALVGMNAALAQENAVERTLPTTSGMSIIAVSIRPEPQAFRSR
jgi:hypothetical protein